MPTIALRYQQASESGFVTTVSIDGQTQYSVTIGDPFTERQEQELEFYFEQWIRFPFDNQVIAQRAAASVQTYGESLFEQIFGGRRAYADYSQACSGGLSQLQIEIEGDSPDFQALHWEALKDPDHPTPLSIEAIFTRKRFRAGGTPDINRVPSPVINLLVVTARPDEESDVGYRTISRPLIEAIHRAQLRVKVEILRPGTFQALAEHLEGKVGHYHIVHFDAHGGLMTYDQFEGGVTQDRYLYKARYGRPDMERYTGQRAFLFFEGNSKGQADPVEAEELAALLTAKGIPICILNACQSAKQVRGEAEQTHPYPSEEGTEAIQNPQSPIQNTETSLGSRLMAAGVQMVVAMGYSVTVTAAQVMMEKLYAELFAQQGIPEAIRLSRKELYNRKERKVYFNQRVPLEDWLLPVVYANRPVDLNLREFTAAEEEAYFVAQADLDDRYRFPMPTYGFVGRDLEILKIEKSLLRHNLLLLQGMGGTGKTTLLRYLWRWWLTTHFVEDAFYFGYDEKAHTLAQICHKVGKRLYGPEQSVTYARFLALSPTVQEAKLAQTLRETPYLLILDNLESVTGQALAIPNTLPAEEQQRLRQFLLKLVNGKTKVIMGSRSNEAWLAEIYTHAGQAHIYALSGLDPEARTELAEKILAAQVRDPQRIAALRVNADFKRLMALLAGYPMAMEVVLTNLARQSPAEILAALNAADVNLNVGGDDKTNNILKCVEYSHSNLSSQAQKLLVCLAPFNGFIDRANLENYGKHLSQREPFRDYDTSQFDAAIQEAIQWGLLSPMDANNPRLLTIQPIFPYFLRTKLNTLDAATRDALYDGFRAHYQVLAGSYQQLTQSKDPHQRQLGLLFCQLEYENLYAVLKICLDKTQNIEPLFSCIQDYLELTQNFTLGLKVADSTCKALEQYPSALINHGKIGDELGVVYQRLGRRHQEMQAYPQARTYYQKSLATYEVLKDLNETRRGYVLGLLNHQLGMVAEEMREYEQARQHYQQSLNIKAEFGDRHEQASTYHHLGIVAQELREYEQARQHFQQALDIDIEFGDRYGQASTYHQLGMVAEAQRKYEQARKYYQQALDIDIEFGDRHRQASTLCALGTAALELGEHKQARQHYHQALNIWIEYGDRYNQNFAYHQLGIVAEAQGEYEQARQHYQQALNIFIEFGDRYSQASTYHQLGMVAEAQREYERARHCYQQALDIYIEFDDRYEQAGTYFQLGKVAEAMGNIKAARTAYLQDLQIMAEFSNEHGLGISLRNLARFYGEFPDEAFLTVVAQCLNTTPAEVQQLFAAANP
ncbi:tetratricopeptide repeat protein [Leptolyngbya sp. CCNP1308]|uniref:tetratricopeptide repeat protein n=1 Tax=Leptolyngbya sp. CCNP1308 TaxID=3110255 RepID=UPI002B20664F|nr:tetratricopeptide repeat protein [Leptolyngbya sp. CCNP1308]MEA5447148.1 tetratricopeptide repeat protein [Leptolyngbya sp. CCNP1308]